MRELSEQNQKLKEENEQCKQVKTFHSSHANPSDVMKQNNQSPR